MRAYCDLRADRIGEILLHVDDIVSAFSAVSAFDLPACEATAEFVALTQDVAILVEMQVKHFLRSPRPIAFSDRIMPVIDTPDHSTFPSGHATEAFAIATVLARLERGHRPKAAGEGILFDLAHRIAVNRTVAGVHFPVDSAAGARLGCAIGEAICALATGGTAARYDFDCNVVPEDTDADKHNPDFNRRDVADFLDAQPVDDVEIAAPSNAALADRWQAALSNGPTGIRRGRR